MSKRKIIKGREIVDDSWVYLDDESPAPTEASQLLLGVERFNREAAQLHREGHTLGVRFGPEHSGRELGEALDEVALVAVDFPKFTDGRGYTVARRLRTQLGWQGQLRAVGDVLPDQVFYLQRCGFDELHVREDKPIEDALAALKTFSVAYQGDAVDPRPLWRRRGA